MKVEVNKTTKTVMITLSGNGVDSEFTSTYTLENIDALTGIHLVTKKVEGNYLLTDNIVAYEYIE